MHIKVHSIPKKKQMTNPFRDQEKFMKACDQSVDDFNGTQFDMYCALIEEEHKELKQALSENDNEEIVDALLDILVVTIGALHSFGDGHKHFLRICGRC